MKRLITVILFINEKSITILYIKLNLYEHIETFFKNLLKFNIYTNVIKQSNSN